MGPLVSNGPKVKYLFFGKLKNNQTSIANKKQLNKITDQFISEGLMFKISFKDDMFLKLKTITTLNKLCNDLSLIKLSKIQNIYLSIKKSVKEINNLEKVSFLMNQQKLNFQKINKINFPAFKIKFSELKEIKSDETKNLQKYIFKESRYKLIIKFKKINKIIYPRTNIVLYGKPTKRI